MCSKLKVNTAWHCLGGFIADLDHSQHINIISCVSTFNFKEAFVSSVRKTSHNVLKKQKARYPISFNNLSLHRIEISYEYLTILQL